MIKEQFKMVTPDSIESKSEESIKLKEAESLNQEIRRIQGARSLENLEVDELKQVLKLYQKIRDIAKPKEAKLEGPKNEQIIKAREIMGIKEVMGPDEIKKAFGIEIAESEIPNIPFNTQELERAKELGQFLVLRVDKAADGKALTMPKMNDILIKDFTKKGAGKILLDTTGWRKNEPFYTNGTPNIGWALTSKEIIKDSTNKNYLQQTETIANHLTNEVYKDLEMPTQYKEAIKEFEAKKEELTRLIKTGDKSVYEPEISKLKLNKLTRQSPVEALYDLLIYFQNNNERLLEKKATWTHATSSTGERVVVGYFDSGGAEVCRRSDDRSYAGLGVVLSRNF